MRKRAIGNALWRTVNWVAAVNRENRRRLLTLWLGLVLDFIYLTWTSEHYKLQADPSSSQTILYVFAVFMSLRKLACGTVLNFSSLSYLAQLA